mgnify:CR=1 FL=1|jgi:hypothetical protein
MIYKKSNDIVDVKIMVEAVNIDGESVSFFTADECSLGPLHAEVLEKVSEHHAKDANFFAEIAEVAKQKAERLR